MPGEAFAAEGSAVALSVDPEVVGDALVYGVSLYALARSDRWKAGAAMVKGGFMLGVPGTRSEFRGVPGGVPGTLY